MKKIISDNYLQEQVKLHQDKHYGTGFIVICHKLTE